MLTLHVANPGLDLEAPCDSLRIARDDSWAQIQKELLSIARYSPKPKQKSLDKLSLFTYCSYLECYIQLGGKVAHKSQVNQGSIV